MKRPPPPTDDALAAAELLAAIAGTARLRGAAAAVLDRSESYQRTRHLARLRLEACLTVLDKHHAVSPPATD